MVIVINHLTRMRAPAICVAGIDPSTNRHIRPILPGVGQLQRQHMGRFGGIFEVGARVEFERMVRKASPPAVEDHMFWLSKARNVGRMPPNEYWNLLASLSKRSLKELFGPELHPIGQSGAGIDRGKGIASLGCLVPSAPPFLYTRNVPNDPPKLRLKISDGDFNLDLGVTDARLYDDDLATPNMPVVTKLSRELGSGTQVIISVGLTRAFSPTEQVPAMHWLQANNFFLENDPLLQETIRG